MEGVKQDRLNIPNLVQYLFTYTQIDAAGKRWPRCIFITWRYTTSMKWLKSRNHFKSNTALIVLDSQMTLKIVVEYVCYYCTFFVYKKVSLDKQVKLIIYSLKLVEVYNQYIVQSNQIKAISFSEFITNLKNVILKYNWKMKIYNKIENLK